MNNNDRDHTIVTGGVSFIGLLQIAFIVLKLCGVIDWSWWVVLIPIWVDIGVVAVVLILALILYLKYGDR